MARPIKNIHINFDLDPLIKKLETAKDDFLIDNTMKSSIYKGIAKGARGKILKGRLRDLKPNTIKIRKKANQMPPIPLFRTGKLQKSIHAKKDGVYIEKYGIDHLEGYTIKAGSNKFTKHWKKDVRVGPRNFLPDTEEIKLSKKDSTNLYKKIQSFIKKRK